MINTNTDITAKQGVEIVIRHDSLVIWINVDGVCVGRIIMNGFIPIDIQDARIEFIPKFIEDKIIGH